MIHLNDYTIQKECDYKGEHYFVRDNGSIMRVPIKGRRVRPSDNEWTFGTPDERTGYMLFCGERVHRIVGYAFLGEPIENNLVIDHIDTNRRNNRPENLRWCTRLENVLNNPITRARIENLCGSIANFLKNPSILRGHENIDPNFNWMRSVTKEEANNTLLRLLEWAKNPKKTSGKGLGDWIYNPLNEHITSSNLNKSIDSYSNQTVATIPEKEILKVQSITPNAIQIGWKTPAEFPCCPQNPSENALEDYLKNLEKSKIFCKAVYNGETSESPIIDFGMSDRNTLWVMTEIQIAWKTHAITKITYKDHTFYHENWGTLDPGDEPEYIFDKILNRDKQ